MEFLVGMFVVTAVLVAVMVFIVARRSRSRSALDPSRDLHQGFPDDKNPSSVGGHLVDTPGSNF
ncbi:hypothetical protein [Catellatospora sp. IY07-71]|uniref:hypothetical protein n=1 Tax=Catellatospora sp. IY07-71 TaxID=2728827 RepID=UPI001BB2F64D|nr:hypothetical protein [Catellatospora sp. IY07-71]